MEHRQMGRSGLTVSALGIGCNNFGSRLDGPATDAVVQRALDAGITHFDSAEAYGNGASEELLGAALGKRRDEAVIATKFSPAMEPGPGQASGSRRNIVRACEASLRRLGTDHIDLYYQHRPDPLTPVDETLAAFTQLIEQGKVRYAASSNAAGWEVADADHLARARGTERFVGTQFEWSLLERNAEAELVPACRHFGVGMVPYFPLAAGMLTGKHRRDEPFAEGTRMSLPYYGRYATDEMWDRIERLTAVAESCGHTILELAVCWLLSQDGVASVITGASTPEQVDANVAASSWRLSADELAAVEEAFGQ